MSDPRYDITLADPVSGESIGLKLDAPFQWQSAQQMATRITEAQDWRSFDEWSVLEQSSFHHGRGLEIWDSSDPERFYDSYNVDTRIRDQMTLAPKATTTSVGAEGFLSYAATDDMLVDSTAGAFLKAAQPFTCSAHTCKKIALRLMKYHLATTAAATLRVETDSSGEPSGTLVHANATTTASVSNTGYSWVEFDFGAVGFALSASTTYWLVVTWGGTTYPLAIQGGFKAGGHPYGTADAMYYGPTDWHAASGVSIFFDLRSVSAMSGTVACFCQMGSKFYCGAGKAVYEWDNTNKYWVAKKTDLTYAVSSMASFGGVLWVAQGGGNAWTFDGTSTWAEKSGIVATYLTVYKGYLYRAVYSTDNAVFYTADGTTWNASAWKVGNPGRSERIKSLAGYEYDMYVGTTNGLYVLGPESRQGDLVDQIKDFTSQYATTNMLALDTWAKDGKLYFNIGHSLISYQEGLLDSVGPDRDAGMPSGRAGTICDLVSLNNWLIAALDAGWSGTSSVLAYNGSGWHELFRSPGSGMPCRAVGFDTTTTPYKLWFGFGSQAGYIEMADSTDNPYQYSSSAYASQGYLITPWIDMDLLSVDKDFQEFGAQCEMPATGTLTVYYEVDRYGSWEQLFSVSATDMDGVYTHTFPFETAFAFSPHTVASGSTALTINVASTTGLEASDWVRINDEIRQIASITDPDTFVLARALSAAPASGDIVYPARPCGAEIRFKIEMETTNSAYTPKLQAWWLKCMPMIRDKLAGAFSAQIYDGQRDFPQAAEIPASTRSALLYSFAKRPTPIDLTDMGGTTRRVKITDIKETQEYTGEGAMAHARVPVSTFSVSVVEV